MKPRVNLTVLQNSGSQSLDINELTPWLSSLLEELGEEVEGVKDKKESISFQGSLTYYHNSRYEDHYILEGNLSSKFYTYCVKTGELILDHLSLDVSALFLDEKYLKQLGLEEETDIVLDGRELDLYFYDQNKQIDLFEIFREYALLEKNAYPQS